VSLRQIQTKLCSLTYSSNCDAHFRRISSAEGVVDTGLQTKSWFMDKLGQKRKFGNTDRAEKVHQEEPRPKRKCMEDDQIQMRHFRRFRFLEAGVFENAVYEPEDVGPPDSPLLKPLKPRLIPTPSHSPLLKPLKPGLLPTPSPPPDGSEVEDNTLVPSQGDRVLISLVSGGKAWEVARSCYRTLGGGSRDVGRGQRRACRSAQLRGSLAMCQMKRVDNAFLFCTRAITP
jgi:hypothetical protein